VLDRFLDLAPRRDHEVHALARRELDRLQGLEVERVHRRDVEGIALEAERE
jgi:hypothetical protein